VKVVECQGGVLVRMLRKKREGEGEKRESESERERGERAKECERSRL
jgi:hypothetical protein